MEVEQVGRWPQFDLGNSKILNIKLFTMFNKSMYSITNAFKSAFCSF